MMRTLTILHLSDLHLDVGLGGLPPDEELRRAVRAEHRAVLTRFVDQAIEREVDLVLLCGDLFHDESRVDPDTRDLFIDQLRRLPAGKTFLIPGNHDPLRQGSPYADRELRYGERVHVFDKPEWDYVLIDHLETVVWGVAYSASRAKQNVLREFAQRGQKVAPAGWRHVGLLHGSLEGGSAETWESENPYPFSEDDIRAAGFDYLALGHYHRFRDILGDGRAVYPGTPFPTRRGEGHEPAAVLGRIGEEARIERLVLTDLRYVKVEVDVSGTESSEELIAEVARALEKAGAGPKSPAWVVLEGTRPAGLVIEPDALRTEFTGKALGLAIEDRTRAPLDLTGIEAEESVAGEFWREATKRIEEARAEAAEGVEGAEERARCLERRREYGITALKRPAHLRLLEREEEAQG